MFHRSEVNSLDQDLAERLKQIRESGLLRELRRVDSPQTPHLEIQGARLLNFSSNDYLGLANHPALKESAIRAVEKFGSGSGASRLICGSLAPHHELEETLAAFKKTEAALSFSSGYAAALGTICALMGKDDIVVLDKLVHASIVDAARLSGAKLRVFSHNNVEELKQILQWADRKNSDVANKRSRILIVTESVFSMDGDLAPLREIVALKNKYGAWLMLDEAHATGLFGQNRRGLAEQEGLGDQVEIQMGTLGKALGASGGYICGSRLLIDFLVNRARSFIFSTAPVPAAAAAATAAVQLVQSSFGEEKQQSLWKLIGQLKSFPELSGSTFSSAIIPLLIGDETKAVEVAAALRTHGVFIPAIRYPTVARGEARLRLTMTAAHSSEDLDKLKSALHETIGNFPK